MMDWFHSSQLGQQILGEGSGSNLRKGYKMCSMTTDCDLDKSETPLLCEKVEKKSTSVWPEKTKPKTNDPVCSEAAAPKKASHGFGGLGPSATEKEKESGKTKTEPRSLSMSYRQEGKSQESEKLLIDFGSSEDKDDEDDDV